MIIAGFPVQEIASQATFEEVAYLLWNDALPTAIEVDEFRQALTAQRVLPDATVEILRATVQYKLPAMDALLLAASTLSLDLSKSEPPHQAVAVLARFPVIMATYARLLKGQTILTPRDDLGHAANYLYLLFGEVPQPEQVRGLETYLNTVLDYGLNASTFTARVIISTGSDLVSAVVGAIGA